MTAWAWILGHKRLCCYAAAILATCWCIRVYGNRQYAAGATHGRQSAAAEVEKAKKAEWAAKEAELLKESERLETDRQELAKVGEQLINDRYALDKRLAAGIEQLKGERIAGYAKSAAVSDSDIWRDVRALSGQLAADAR
jgi:glycerol-3-phosphate O-acyltransferase